MSNQLAPLNHTAPATTGDAYQSLEVQAAAMANAMKLATALCATAMVPKPYQGKPEDGAAAILYGAELGLNPTQSLQQIMVINGKPGMETRTAIGLLKKHGYLVETLESSDELVTVRVTSPTGEVETCTWDLARATKAGYTSNALYKKIPQQMLYAKAAMEAARKIAPHVLSGIAYSQDELRLEPVRMEASREDRGMSAVRQALAEKKQTQLAAPADSGEDQEPEGDVEADVFATLTIRVQNATTEQELKEAMRVDGDRTKLTKEQDAQLRSLATARMNELTQGSEA